MAKMTKEDRDLALKETLRALNKKNPDSVRSASSLPPCRRVPLNIPAYDYVNFGGVIINQVNEHYGDPSGLKSLLFYIALAKFQRYDWANDEPNAFTNIEFKKRKNPMDIPEVLSYKLRRGYKPKNEPQIKYAALVDMEGTYSPDWGSRLGIYNDGLIYTAPDSLNTSIDITDALLRNPAICIVMYDSMIAIGADAEQEASMENEQMAINARMWNKGARKFRGAMNSNPEKDITLVAVNGFYEKVGVVFGNPEVVKNGKGFQLLKSLSTKMTTLKEHKGKVNEKEITVGRNIKLTNKKNKFGPQFREMTMYFSYVDDGELEAGDTDIMQQLIELGVQYSLIERVGNGYQYANLKSKGMESFKKLMYAEGMQKQLMKDVYEKML